MPTLFNVPTLSILAPTLLDFGTEEQKQRHIPAILRGEELWVQFLSEPSGGSDLAGLVTRATRDGDVFVLNGSKIWSSGAFRSDYAMCLARTDRHVPKHQGLTMFIVKIHQPGIEVQRITMVNGMAEFCQEFFDDVAIPVADVVGEVNDGWTVASRLLYPRARGGGRRLALRERRGGGRGRPGRASAPTWSTWPGTPARPTIPIVRQLVAEDRVNDRVGQQLTERVTTGIRTGALPAPAGAIARLFAATNTERHLDIGLEIAGPGRRGVGRRTTRPAVAASSTSPVRAAAWEAGSNEMHATSSASGCWACPGSTPPTVTSPSTRCATTASPQTES